MISNHASKQPPRAGTTPDKPGAQPYSARLAPADAWEEFERRFGVRIIACFGMIDPGSS